MKWRILSAFIYGIAAVALALFFDGLYGGEPITHHLKLIYVATAGAALFAIACVLSLFTLRFAAVFGLAASILSWPYFGIQLCRIPWLSLFTIVHSYSNWQDTLTAILALVISSVYSVTRLRLLLRAPATDGTFRG